jgi:hypothetical protein
MTIGAGIGFILAIVFTITALLNYDDTETTAGYVAASSLLIGMPILVVMGVFAGWLWDIFIKGKK